MRIPQRQLERELRRGLAGAYLIAGDEPLLVDEAAEAVRTAAAGAGFDERELYIAERGFRWAALAAGADNFSLFASRRVIELRMPAPRPGDDGSQAIRSLVERPDPDRILILLIGGKLDDPARRSVWVRCIEKHGVVVDVWPIERRELSAWVAARAKRAKLTLTSGAAELLADRVEGNLLAADQEIRKLALTRAGAQIDEAAVLDAVASNARFDVFRLTDAMLAGDARRAIRVLRALRAEGVAPPLVSWALIRELQLLARLKFALRRGDSIDAVLGRERIWPRRHPLLKQALARLGSGQLTALLVRATEVDGTVKGVIRADPWDALIGLLLAVLDPPQARGVPAA